MWGGFSRRGKGLLPFRHESRHIARRAMAPMRSVLAAEVLASFACRHIP